MKTYEEIKKDKGKTKMSIAKSYDVSGFYGSNETPVTVLVCEMIDGARWFCVAGSIQANCTYDDIVEGTNVELLEDVDCFTRSKPIEDLETLIIAVQA